MRRAACFAAGVQKFIPLQKHHLAATPLHFVSPAVLVAGSRGLLSAGSVASRELAALPPLGQHGRAFPAPLPKAASRLRPAPAGLRPPQNAGGGGPQCPPLYRLYSTALLQRKSTQTKCSMSSETIQVSVLAVTSYILFFTLAKSVRSTGKSILPQMT